MPELTEWMLVAERPRPNTRKPAIATAAVALSLLLAVSGCAGLAAPTGNDRSTGGGTSEAPANDGIPEEAVPMTVDYVHDGDTLFLKSADGEELKVRLIGIDTPELSPEPECYAEEATARLRELAPEGSTLWVTTDEDLLDRYGRSLFYAWNDSGEFVNRELVRGGFAKVVVFGNNDAWWVEFRVIEATASATNTGLWRACES